MTCESCQFLSGEKSVLWTCVLGEGRRKESVAPGWSPWLEEGVGEYFPPSGTVLVGVANPQAS